MKHLTILFTLLLMTTFGLFAAKKGGQGQATAPPTSLSVSCSTCPVGQSMTITASGFTHNANGTLTVSGPYTALTTVQLDNNGGWTVTYLTGLHFPAGTYNVSLSDTGGVFAASSFIIP